MDEFIKVSILVVLPTVLMLIVAAWDVRRNGGQPSNGEFVNKMIDLQVKIAALNFFQNHNRHDK